MGAVSVRHIDESFGVFGEAIGAFFGVRWVGADVVCFGDILPKCLCCGCEVSNDADESGGGCGVVNGGGIGRGGALADK